MFRSMQSGSGTALRAIGSGMRSVGEKIRPNIVLAMLLVAVLGVVVSFFGFKKGRNEAIISGVGVGAIVAIVNLAGKILESKLTRHLTSADRSGSASSRRCGQTYSSP